jgi:predicted AAA+ superfamily ATPase
MLPIQKVPAPLDVIHQLVETSPPRRFILTGTSARKLWRWAANLWAGRLVQAEMHPFMAAELGDGFSLQRALKTSVW